MLFDAGLGHDDSKLGEDEVGRTDFVSGKHCFICIHLPHSACSDPSWDWRPRLDTSAIIIMIRSDEASVKGAAKIDLI